MYHPLRLIIIIFVLFPTLSYSYDDSFSFRCNQKITLCEVDNNRLTVGDWVGIFDKSGNLIAFGKVTKLKGHIRVFRINRRFSKITGRHRVRFVSDYMVRDPKKYFQFAATFPKSSWGASIGQINLTLGEGIAANDFTLYHHRPWTGGVYFNGGLHYVSGSGKATVSESRLESHLVDVTFISLYGGISTYLGSYEALYWRIGGGFGLTLTSVDGGGPYTAEQLVDGRVENGTHLSIWGRGSILFKRQSHFLAASFYLIKNQRTLNPAISLGIERSFSP